MRRVFRRTAFATLVVPAMLAVFLIVHEVNRWTRKPEVPTTKHGPECAMAIPLAAKRCGHCTTLA